MSALTSARRARLAKASKQGTRGKLLLRRGRGAAHKPSMHSHPPTARRQDTPSMAFCPVPHTTRDQVWLAVGVAIGVAVTLAVSRKR